MDFGRVVALVGGHLEARAQPWALVGGIGLAAYGMVRFTLDLDIVVPAAEQESLVEFLTGEGYELLHRSRAFSSHLHAEPDLGRLDVMYVQGDTERRIFAAVRLVEGAFGKAVPVAAPGHLLAMKAQAYADDPSRRSDLLDIRYLLQLPGVDRVDARAAFAKRGLEKLYDELEASL